MNTYKNIFRACNGTRIAQCSLLIALAFLCLSIVFMCVFYNLNALATNNIAFAEEDIPSVVYGYNDGLRILNGGYYEPNLFYDNYCAGWTYSVSSTSTSVETLVASTEDYAIYIIGNGSITNNVLSVSSGWVELRYYPLNWSNLGNANYTFCLGYSRSGSNSQIGFRNSSTQANFGSVSLSWSASYVARQNYTLDLTSNGNLFFYIYTESGQTLDLSYIYLSTRSSFLGYVAPSYSNYGYDQGYADGVANGSSPDYSTISSTGIVRDNLINNNNCNAWNYNLAFNSSRFLSGDILNVFDASNVSCYLQYSGSGSLVDNLLSCDSDSHCYLVFKFKDNVLSASSYTFSVGLSHYSIIGYDSLYLESGSSNGLAFNYSEDYDSGSYISFTCDLSNSSVYPDLDGVYFAIYLGEESSVNIEWVKLELGESFSGYVPIDYSMYGYQDGYNKGNADGYSEGYDNAKLESFNRIGTLFEVDNYSSVSQYYPLGTDKVLISYVAETDSFTFNGTTYRLSYFDTQGDDSVVDGRGVYNGYVLEYSFQYKIRVNTLFFSNWDRLGFKLLVIREDNHNDYFFITREDTSYITYLSTWTGTDFGDIQQVQIDIPLQGSYNYQLAFVPINWNYHDINAQSRDLRAGESYQDTSTFLIWDNTEIFGLTDNSAYQNIVEQRIEDAWAEGHYDGLQEGKSIGYTNGYNTGYTHGVDAAGDYTFYSLLGAVFDTPISTLRGLLNFNILGVNLYDFVIALLSLAIVLFVFRIFVRGL